MKLFKKFQPWKAVCNNDDPHDVKNKIFVERERLVCSDGRILAFIPIETNKNDSIRNLLDPYIFKEAINFSNPELDFVEMKLKGDAEEGKAIFKNGIELPFQLVKADQDLISPNYNDIITTTEKPKCSFSINVNQLKKLSDAIGSNSIVINYYGPTSIIKITPLDPVSTEVGYISFTKTE